MEETTKQSALDWDRLLTYTQKKKYENAIRQGYFDDFHGRSWKHDTFYGAFLWKHPNRVKIINRFTEIVGHKPTWDDITDDNLRDLFEELKKNYSPNSVKTLTAEIKAVLQENGDTKDIPSIGFKKILKGKTVPVQGVYVTDEEIKRILDYNPRGRCERYVKRMFIIECLTGARASDCLHLSEGNIDESGRMLVYVSQKSNTEVHVPIHKWLRPYLTCGTADEPTGGFGLGTYNRTIREICRKCGINKKVKVFSKGKTYIGEKWEFVTSHTGRRSFATNLAMKGAPIEQISILMGHMSGNRPNVPMTQRYIVGKISIDKNIMKMFGAYDEIPATDDEKKELNRMKRVITE